MVLEREEKKKKWRMKGLARHQKKRSASQKGRFE
jgi:hypothetical protein